MTLANIDEAVAAGASQAAACALVGLDERTVQRWRTRPDLEDQRRGPTRRPGNALTATEEAELVALLTSKEFGGLSPHQLVAKLADQGRYFASEATMYRLLRSRRLLRHRDRARPRTRRGPREHVATGPNPEPSPQISPKAAGKIAWRRISASNAVISSTRRSSRMFGSAS